MQGRDAELTYTRNTVYNQGPSGEPASTSAAGAQPGNVVALRMLEEALENSITSAIFRAPVQTQPHQVVFSLFELPLEVLGIILWNRRLKREEVDKEPWDRFRRSFQWTRLEFMGPCDQSFIHLRFHLCLFSDQQRRDGTCSSRGR